MQWISLSYGLERVKLDHEIGLDESDTELTPQNPIRVAIVRENRRLTPSMKIIRSFNERWFQG